MRHARFCCLLLLTLLLKSCDVPDVQPFTKATTAMAAAVDGSLKRVLADLGRVKLPLLSAQDRLNQERLDTIRQQLAHRSKRFSAVAHAFDTYAQSLDEIAAVGKERGAKIDKAFDATLNVVDKSKKFLGVVPALQPVAVAATPVLKALQKLTADLSKAKTTHRLSRLASPQQDSAIQLSAQLLRLGLRNFYLIDSTAYQLFSANLPEPYRHTTYWYQFTSQRQDSIVGLLYALTEAEKYARLGQDGNLRSPGFTDLPIDRIERGDYDPQRTVLRAYTALATSRPADKKAARTNLVDALRKRELFYRPLAELPQAYLDAAQLKYGGPVRDAALITKSMALIDTWASSHHELRLLLAKAKQITRQDVVEYAKTVKTLADELKNAEK